MYPKLEKPIGYGTAGFRDKASILPIVLYRVGMLAALRSRYLDGKIIGVMITASHNPPQDNGAKIVDPLGDMLEPSWEAYATELANAETDEICQKMLDDLYKSLNVSRSITANILAGRDTRESGSELMAALEKGVQHENGNLTNVYRVTTPQLHYLVRAYNTLVCPEYESYGVPTQDGYYRKLCTAFIKMACIRSNKKALNGRLPLPITIDCANGVGALKIADLSEKLKDYVAITLCNNQCDEPDKLNMHCGADYVKTTQSAPANVDLTHGELAASFDGDADRVVFYYMHNNEFRLLDGDKIATLAALSLGELVKKSGASINIGVVQTAYANGASTKYLQSTLGVPTVCVSTGVKHLHQAAHQFDIGIYFEANGHGTVLFDPDVISKLRTFNISCPDQKEAVDTLLALSDLINQTVGDAISDLLMVIIMLGINQWSAQDWDKCYTDLPNQLRKVAVQDRTIFKTEDAERVLVSPAGVQKQIDEIVHQYPQGRSFIRASGTEDVVRIYAEAAENVDELMDKVTRLLDPWALK